MQTIEENSASAGPPMKFIRGDDLLRSLGGVPISRVRFNPGPGTATEADLLELMAREGVLCELVGGTLVEKPVGYEESLIAQAIATAIRIFIAGRKMGIVSGPDATLRMSKGNIRLPDVSFVSAADLPGGKRPKVAAPTLPPTLAIEVVSATNTPAEMRKKSGEYFDSGAKLVWIVYPKTQTVAVFDKRSPEPREVLSLGDNLDGEAVIPGFSMPLAAVFEISEFE